MLWGPAVEEQLGIGRTQSSEEDDQEEEPVARNQIKRQSQILFDAKTRKGRFNTQGGMATRPRKF